MKKLFVETGSGMMARTIERKEFDLTDPADRKLIASESFRTRELEREQVAKGLVEDLERSGVHFSEPDRCTLRDPDSLAKLNSFPKDSPLGMANTWLLAYRDCRDATAELRKGANVELASKRLTNAAERMGVIQERLWWRAGRDHQTGRNREELALSGRKQTKAGSRGRAMRTETSFAIVHGDAAQIRANNLAAENPHLTWAAIQRILARKYQFSTETIRKALRNPKKGR